MLAKQDRLNLSIKENSSIFIRGNSKFFSSEFFLAYLRRNESGLLVACLTPRAIFNKASKRNYYRRLLYSFIEGELAEKKLTLQKKIDLVVVLKKNFHEAEDKDKLAADFKQLMQKVENDQNG